MTHSLSLHQLSQHNTIQYRWDAVQQQLYRGQHVYSIEEITLKKKNTGF